MAYGGFIWTPPRNSGAIPYVSTRFSLSMEMSRLTRDGTAEPVSRDQILRHARGQGNINFPCSADHEQDWQPYPVDPYSAICDDHTYIHTYIHVASLRRKGNTPVKASVVAPSMEIIRQIYPLEMTSTRFI